MNKDELLVLLGSLEADAAASSVESLDKARGFQGSFLGKPLSTSATSWSRRLRQEVGYRQQNVHESIMVAFLKGGN